MFKRSFWISVLLIVMAFVWVSESNAVTCSRCRRSPWAICYAEILEKIKSTFKVSTAGLAKIEIVNLSLGAWYNPAGQLQLPPGGDPYELPS